MLAYECKHPIMKLLILTTIALFTSAGCKSLNGGPSGELFPDGSCPTDSSLLDLEREVVETALKNRELDHAETR